MSVQRFQLPEPWVELEGAEPQQLLEHAAQVQRNFDRLRRDFPVSEAWHHADLTGGPAFQNGWNNYGAGFATGAYFRDATGIVHLRGLVKDGTMSATIFTLPPGNRPDGTLIFPAASLSAYGEVRVAADGTVVATIGSNAWVDLSSVHFRAEA